MKQTKQHIMNYSNNYFQAQNITPAALFNNQQLSISVTDLQFSEINLLYHQLKLGAQLQVNQFVENGVIGLGLFFKGVMVGKINAVLSKQMIRNMMEGVSYIAKVAKVERKKFLPPTAIEVLLNRI